MSRRGRKRRGRLQIGNKGLFNNWVITPFGKNSLVQVHENGVLGLQGSVEGHFHMAMSSKGFLDMSLPPEFGPQLDGFKPINVLSIEKHVPHDGAPHIYFEGMSTQNGLFDNHTVGVHPQERTRGHHVLGPVRVLLEHHNRGRGEGDGSVN